MRAAGYRERILQTDSKYGCPLGRLALEIDPENRTAHRLIAENFRGWIGTVRECVDQMRKSAAWNGSGCALHLRAGGHGGRCNAVATYGSVEPVERTVAQLRQHFQLLLSAENRSSAPAAKAK